MGFRDTTQRLWYSILLTNITNNLFSSLMLAMCLMLAMTQACLVHALHTLYNAYNVHCHGLATHARCGLLTHALSHMHMYMHTSFSSIHNAISYWYYTDTSKFYHGFIMLRLDGLGLTFTWENTPYGSCQCSSEGTVCLSGGRECGAGVDPS